MIWIYLIITLLGNAPPRVIDVPNDGGNALMVEWQLPPDSLGKVDSMLILRKTLPEGKVDTVAKAFTNHPEFVDEGVNYKKAYRYSILYFIGPVQIQSKWSSPAEPVAGWIDTRKIPLFILMMLYTTILLVYIFTARKGRELYLRPIAGLEAVDEAVGRATEMGRPIVYIPGLSTISDVATIAALNILAHITKKAGEYETKIIVPVRNPVVYTIAREVIKEAYYTIGRPDLFDPGQVYFATDSQFGYAAHVSALMAREKSATNFFMGMFWAESLILAETGASTGAIQVAGTDAVTQLPFFVVTCDYTLIGEELYAASAYLSKEPLLTASIKGQDQMKLLIMVAMILLSLLSVFGVNITLGLF